MRAALILDQEFQDAEAIYPFYRLQEAGFDVDLVGRDKDVACTGKYGYTLTTTTAAKKAKARDYDVIVVPGGNAPDKMRTFGPFVDLVRGAADEGVLLAAICHGPELLIDADVVRGRNLTSYVAIRRDLENAGAAWSDQEVVADTGLVTSRKPDDLPAFMATVLGVLGEQGLTDGHAGAIEATA